MQDLPRIDKTIADGTFFTNQELCDAYIKAQQGKRSLHLIGLVSAGGVHSHINHLFALLDLAAKMKFNNIYIHMITDGRDTPAQVALTDLKSLEQKCSQLGIGKIASIAGRYFAMDRDHNWERTIKTYDAFVSGKAPIVSSASEAIQNSYHNQKYDEFIEPVQIANTPRISDGDSIVFFNYRSDRSKQISACIIDPDFKDFSREKTIKDFYFVSFTSYGH